MEMLVEWITNHELLMWGLGLSTSLVLAIIFAELIHSTQKLKEILKYNHRRITHDNINTFSQRRDIGFYHWDLEHNELVWSDNAYALFGLDRHILPNMSFFLEKIVHPDDREKVKQTLNQSISQRIPFDVEYKIIRTDGKIRHIHEAVSIISNYDQINPTLSGIWEDITDRKIIESRLQKKESILKVILENSPISIWHYSKNKELMYANKVFCEEVGISIHKNLKHGNIRDYISEEIMSSYFTTVSHELKETCTTRKRAKVTLADKRKHVVDIIQVPLMDSSGEIKEIIGLSQDITRYTKTKELLRRAFKDEVAGLADRKIILEDLKRQMSMAKRHDYQCALLLLECDNFDMIQNTYGPELSTEFLQQVNHRLKHEVRQEDLVARFGQDKFIVILSNIGNDPVESFKNAYALSEKTLRVLTQGYHINNQHFSIFINIGICLFPSSSIQNADEALKYADLALYTAKSTPQNPICFYESNEFKEKTPYFMPDNDIKTDEKSASH